MRCDENSPTDDATVLTHTAISADPVASLALPLPQHPPAELLEEAYFAARTVMDWTSDPAVERLAEQRVSEIDNMPGVADLADAGEREWHEEMALKYPAIAAWAVTRAAEIDRQLEGGAELPTPEATYQGVAPFQEGRADLDARVAELVKLVGAEDSLTVDAAALRQTMLADAIKNATGPQEAEALIRMQDAATQDFAAHLGILAAISLDALGQHDDAAALRNEATARTEIAATLRLPPDHSPPSARMPSPEAEETSQPSDFRTDAEAAARANGFGQSATLVFVQPITQEATMQGTNPAIVFEEGRASIAPGGNDYSALHAPAEEVDRQPTLEEFMAAVRAKREASEQDNQHQAALEGAQQPEATMTRIPTIGMGPGGAVLMEVNHSPDADVRTEALEASNYAEPIRPGVAVDAPQTVESAITNSQADARAPDTKPTLEEFMANVKREIEGDRGGQEAEAGMETAAAFRSFGR